jgi:hypothetical protein
LINVTSPLVDVAMKLGSSALWVAFAVFIVIIAVREIERRRKTKLEELSALGKVLEALPHLKISEEERDKIKQAVFKRFQIANIETQEDIVGRIRRRKVEEEFRAEHPILYWFTQLWYPVVYLFCGSVFVVWLTGFLISHQHDILAYIESRSIKVFAAIDKWLFP